MNTDLAEKRPKRPHKINTLTLRGYLVISLFVGTTVILALSAACLWLAVNNSDLRYSNKSLSRALDTQAVKAVIEPSGR